MTFGTIFNDWTLLCVFLLAGYLLREWIPLFQKLFLPASVIAGFIALIGGPQVLGWWAVPKSFGSYASPLIVLVMACLVWGVTVDKKRVVGYLDYICMINGVRFAQIAVGAVVGIGLRTIWKDLPLGWGSMGVASYLGGHGTAAAYGSVFKELGVEGNFELGMLMSTLGLLTAVTVGMVIVNIGVRKGWCQYMKLGDKRGEYTERRLLPPDKRVSIGNMRVPGGSINALAFQFAMLMALIWLGGQMFRFLGANVHPMFRRVPPFVHGVTAAIIVWPILRALKLGDYVDRKTCTTISGFSLDILIVGSIGTMNLKLVSAFAVPILIHFLLITAATSWICFWYNYKITENEWFERAVFIFGQSTGSTPTGLALVRAIDPDSVATPGEAHAVASGFGAFATFWVAPLVPVLAVNSPMSEIGLGIVGTIVSLGIGWFLFRKKMKALGR